MNHIYCSIYNERTGAVVTVSEYAGGGGKRAVGGRQPGRPAWALNSLAVAAALVLSPVSHASPAGGAVVAGSATISNAAKNTTINQTSQNAVLNWQSFNIGTGESVRFVQPNGQSVALNRVLGTDPSSILGSLSANGKVFLVNPNGILFGTGAQVTVGALVASTRDISVSDFLAGHYKFSGDGHGSVVNQGSIQAAGGYVALLGASVSNQGVISAKLGTVALAAGNAITLDVAGDGLLNVSVDAGAVDALVQNGGLIQADGGQVLLTAQSASGLLLAAVNNSGTIEAQTIENRNGSIKLLGDMQSGTVNAGGTLDASAPNGGDGGFIETSAAHVKIDPASIVTAAAAHGAAGNWLIDPVDFTVATSGGDMTGAQLSTNLGSSNVTIQSGSGASGVNGDINVNDKVSWSANQLTLSASHDINFNAALTGSGTASLALKYGQGAPAAGNSAAVNVNAPVNLPTGNNLSETLGSDGAPVNYAVINDMTGLQAINSNLAGNYALGSDLDATGVSGFAPLGPITAYNDTAHEFSGSFDGLGHTISNLTISKPSNNFIGMFSGTASAATIKNVGLLNANVTGVYDVAALVGFNYGTISNSYATGVTTGADFVGGLIGYNSVGTITNTYANVTVTTGPNYDTSGGGLIAYNYFGTINNSYAAGSVTAANSGGLVGFFNGGTINSGYSIAAVHLNTYGHSPGGLTGSQANGAVANNSYWDITTSGQTGSSSGVGLTTAQLEAALPTGFSSAFWGNSGNQTTPYLLHNPGPVLISTDTSNTYYKIVLSLDQLQRMNSNLAGAYALGNDIDASATGVWNFVPVGNSTTAFTGTFDGLRHNIAGLSVNLNADNAGLFGVNGVAGTIRNVILTGANIYNGTHSNAGSLVGYNQGAVANAYSTSLSVNGGRNAGGLVGTNVGTIDTSATGTGNVGATFFSGGLVGYNNNAGAIRNTYSGVNAGSYLEVGGLVGGMDAGTVENSYSTGTPYGSTATFGTGGFIGYVGGGTVTNSFWNSSNYSVGVRTGSSTGFTGLSSAAMKTQGSFTPAGAGAGQWDFTNVWYMYEGSTTPLLRAFLTPLTVTANNVAGTYSGQAYSGTPGVSYSTTPNMSNVFGSVAFAGGGTNVGTYSLTPSGLYSNQLGYMISFAAGTLTINPYSVSLTGSRAYDGTNVVAASYLTLGALANGETLTLAGTGTVVDKNAGTGKTVSLGTLALGDGTGMASNYIFTGGTQTADITPKALTATATAQDKIYDGNTTASATLGGLAGLVGSEAVGVSGTATFNSKDVANASLVTVNSVTLSDGTNGGLASNYALASGQTAVAHIRPKALTATATAQDKVYNGNTTASATLGGLTGLIGSETVGVSGTGNFNSKDVVYANLVTVNSITLSDGTNGGLASNYALASGETAAAHITPRALTATANAQDKVYDGNTTASATLGGFTGLAGSETLGVIGTATFNSKDVANANLVTVNSITLSNGTNGGLASNYALAGGETAVAHITPRALTATVTAQDKVYDGNTAASATLGGLSGLIGGETVGVSETATFNSKNVTNANLVTVNGVTLTAGTNGGLASNYALASGETAAAHITPKALTATATAQDKVYDGNTTASATVGGLTGIAGTETLGVSGTATFNSKDVADANLVTVNSITLSDGTNGGLASNYALASGETAVAHIAPKGLTAMTAAQDKIYDGNTTASVTLGGLTGLIGSETVGVSGTGTFNSKDVANANLVTVNSTTLSDGTNGGRASNYRLASGETAVAHITPKSLTVAGQTASDKVYDGMTTATLTGGTVSGLVNGETVALSQAGTFASANVGNAIAVAAADTVGGAAVGNYTLTQPTGLRANIGPMVKLQSAVSSALASAQVTPAARSPAGSPPGITSPTVAADSGGSADSGNSGGSGGSGSSGGTVSSGGPVSSTSSTGSSGSAGETQYEVPGLNLSVTVQDVSLPSSAVPQDARDDKK